MKAPGLSRVSAGLCICHPSCPLLLALLSFQVELIGLQLCAADPVALTVVHGGQLGPALGFSSLSKNRSVFLVKLGSQVLRPGLPQVSEPTRAFPDACCFCGDALGFGGLFKQWELRPGPQNEAAGSGVVTAPGPL